jgi:RNA polymerase sigma-70 factor (ECF subfamily)
MATEPIEELVERQLSERMSKALASLSLEQRQVLILADVEEYSYQEIADIVGCSIGTVRSRLHRARHQLRRQIESQTTSS